MALQVTIIWLKYVENVSITILTSILNLLLECNSSQSRVFEPNLK